MLEIIKQDILQILHISYGAILKEDILELREQSNHTLHNASIYQEPESITIAVVIHAISKIYGREGYKNLEGWKLFHQTVLKNLQQAKKELFENNQSSYEAAIKRILDSIERLDPKLKRYIKQVFQLAKINKASRFYEHGLSLGRTAQLLGLNKWDIMEYTGKTGISDVEESKTMTIKKRLDLTKEIFSL